MSIGWVFVLLGFASILWPFIQFMSWCRGKPEEGDFERWVAEQPLSQMLFLRALGLSAFGLAFTGLALVAL